MALGLKGEFVVDTRATTLEPINDGIFTVDTNAVRLEAYGLVGSDFAVVQILVGPDSGDALWTDLYLAGQKVQLSGTNSQVIIMLGGKYRVHYPGSAEVVVYSEYDSLLLDKNVFYNYQQPNPASGSGGSGFTLTANDTGNLDLTFTGDTSGGTLTGDVVASPDEGNTIIVKPNGVFSPTELFTMPWTAEVANFSIPASENHAYTVTADSETTVTANLPNSSLVSNKIYLILAQGLGTVQVTANGGIGTINGVSGPTTILTGSTVLLYPDTGFNWLAVIGGVV